MQYEIKKLDLVANIFVVKYTNKGTGESLTLNLPRPVSNMSLLEGEDLQKFILAFVPETISGISLAYADIDTTSIDSLVVAPTEEEKEAEMQIAAEAERNALLAETDWYAIRASEPEGKPVPEEILAYRHALRELDQHPDWPEVEWPVLQLVPHQ